MAVRHVPVRVSVRCLLLLLKLIRACGRHPQCRDGAADLLLRLTTPINPGSLGVEIREDLP